MTGTPETFSIKSEELGRTRRIAVTGELDLMTCMRLRGCFDRVLPSTAKAIEVDLSAVTMTAGGERWREGSRDTSRMSRATAGPGITRRRPPARARI